MSRDQLYIGLLLDRVIYTKTMSSIFSKKSRGVTTSDDRDDVSEQRSVTRSIFGSRSRKGSQTASNRAIPKQMNRSSSLKNFRSHDSDVGSITGWLSRASSKKSNNQIVADFFDVQSFASAPAVGTRSVNSKQRSNKYETQSVVSKKSVSGNFLSFFFRMKNVINDEVDDPEVVDYSNFYAVDDEELTLGSGLQSEMGESSYYDDNEDSTVVVKEKIQTLMQQELSVKTTKKKGILGRILQRRKDAKARKMAEKEARRGTNSTRVDGKSVSSRIGRAESLRNPPDHTVSSTTVQVPTMAQKPPVSTSSEGESACTDSSSDDDSSSNDDVGKETSSNKSVSCRWSCDGSIESSSSAPKPPIRRNDSSSKIEIMDDNNKQQNIEIIQSFQSSAPRPPQRRVSDQASPSIDITLDPTERTPKSEQDLSWRDNVRLEIALRSGKDHQESKENYDDGSDESVLSLLSGLLATWSAERDGTKSTDQVHLSAVACGISFAPKKSILKSSSACPDAKPRHSVKFDNIVIREYERTVGDNPSCSRGPPISIGWAYIIAHEYPIDDYELLIKAPKRSKKEFHLSADIRTHLLMDEWDCTDEDIRKARREVTYIQYCRAKASFAGVRTASKESNFLRKGANVSADNIKCGSKPLGRRPGQPEIACGHSSSPKLPNRPQNDLIPPSSAFRQQVLSN